MVELGDKQRAVEEFRQAATLAPDYEAAQQNLELALIASGSLDEGLTRLELAVKLKPGDAGSHANLGTADRIARRFLASGCGIRQGLRTNAE